MSDSDNTIPAGFRAIPGYPRYAIDEHGTILSICGRGPGNIRHWKDALRVNPAIDKDGYRKVSLRHDGRGRQIFIHKLVLITFIGPRPVGHQCRHVDGNPENNHISNLAWGTSLENQHDRVCHGTDSRGERHGRVKLKDSDVLEIRRRAANGERISNITKDFPLDRQSIYRIVNRQSWKHI